MRNMKLVVSNGRLLAEHKTTLNEEQISRFNDAIHWYEKATDKIAKRYAKGIPQKKEQRYAEAVAVATEETEEIEEYYKKVLSGDCAVEEFKERIKIWFFKVRDGMNDVDAAAREAKEPWCDYEDKR